MFFKKIVKNRFFIFLITIVILIASYFFYISIQSEFTSIKWKAREPENKLDLAKSFLKKYYYDGMSLSELKSYLGEPDFDMGPNNVAYIVGTNVIDDIVLSFNISDSGKTSGPKIFSSS